ncbi:MAG: hypothetical protein ACRYGR_03235 [Janthinobacterium lividum]
MDYRSMKKVAASILVLGALTSCSDMLVNTPGIEYKKSNTIMLSVNNLQVISVPNTVDSKNKHVLEENKIFHEEAEKWAHRRFAAQGGVDRAVLIITKAKIRLMRENGHSEDHYEGMIHATLDILDDRGMARARISGDVDLKVNIPDTFTIHEKRAQVKKMRQDLINALDAKMVKEISQHMMAFTNVMPSENVMPLAAPAA